MRDTLIMVVVLGAITWAAASFKELRTLGPRLSLPTASLAKKSAKGTAAKSTTRYQGVPSERPSSQLDHTSEVIGASEGSSADVAEAPVLPSIYSKRKVSPTAGLNKRSKGPVIGGVPVQAFVLSRQDKLSLPPVAGPADSRLRLYVQCMEYRQKNFEDVGKRECSTLYRPTDFGLARN